VVEVAARRLDFASRAHPLERTSLWQWRQEGNGPTPVSDLDRLAALDSPEQFARSLSKLSDANTSHVLHIAPQRRICKLTGSVPHHRRSTRTTPAVRVRGSGIGDNAACTTGCRVI